MSKNNRKSIKTQGSIFDAFDQSIELLILDKINRIIICYSKNNFTNISNTIKDLQKDLNIITSKCKDKNKIHVLLLDLQCFQLIYLKEYTKCLEILDKNNKYFDYTITNCIVSLTLTMIKALVLKHLQKQEQSKSLILIRLSQLDFSKYKHSKKETQQKIIELSIMCITLVAQQFSNFNNCLDFIEIYRKAYKMAIKYLTQYHKLTQILHSICSKYKNEQKIKQNTQLRRKLLRNKSTKQQRKQSISQVNSIIKSTKQSITQQKIHKVVNSRKAKPLRMKTLEPMKQDWGPKRNQILINIYSEEMVLNASHSKRSSINNQKVLYKRPRYSTSLVLKDIDKMKQSSQMKQLQAISKLYLPKIDNKKQIKNSKDDKNHQKLQSIDILMNNPITQMKSKHTQMKSKHTQTQKIRSQPNTISNIKKQSIQFARKQYQINQNNNVNIQKNTNQSNVKLQQKTKQSKQFKKQQTGCQLI